MFGPGVYEWPRKVICDCHEIIKPDFQRRFFKSQWRFSILSCDLDSCRGQIMVKIATDLAVTSSTSLAGTFLSRPEIVFTSRDLWLYYFTESGVEGGRRLILSSFNDQLLPALDGTLQASTSGTYLPTYLPRDDSQPRCANRGNSSRSTAPINQEDDIYL